MKDNKGDTAPEHEGGCFYFVYITILSNRCIYICSIKKINTMNKKIYYNKYN